MLIINCVRFLTCWHGVDQCYAWFFSFHYCSATERNKKKHPRFRKQIFWIVRNSIRELCRHNNHYGISRNERSKLAYPAVAVILLQLIIPQLVIFRSYYIKFIKMHLHSNIHTTCVYTLDYRVEGLTYNILDYNM